MPSSRRAPAAPLRDLSLPPQERVQTQAADGGFLSGSESPALIALSPGAERRPLHIALAEGRTFTKSDGARTAVRAPANKKSRPTPKALPGLWPKPAQAARRLVQRWLSW
jgi:hypothetical protein